MKRRRRTSMPIMLFWSKRDQKRFIDAVERFCSMVNDLEVILAPVKRKRKMTSTTNGHAQPATAAAASSS